MEDVLDGQAKRQLLLTNISYHGLRCVHTSSANPVPYGSDRFTSSIRDFLFRTLLFASPSSIMSIDLEWEKLGVPLSSSLVDILNRQLASTARPSFIGPVEVTSLDFGSNAPETELIDLRDIYRDFLEDDDEDGGGEGRDRVKVPEGQEDDEGFEWVSRKWQGSLKTSDLHITIFHHTYGMDGIHPQICLHRHPVCIHQKVFGTGESACQVWGIFRQTTHTQARPSPSFYQYTCILHTSSPHVVQSRI